MSHLLNSSDEAEGLSLSFSWGELEPVAAEMGLSFGQDRLSLSLSPVLLSQVGKLRHKIIGLRIAVPSGSDIAPLVLAGAGAHCLNVLIVFLKVFPCRNHFLLCLQGLYGG